MMATEMAGAQVVHADAGLLQAHLRDDALVLVDFWADWCAPCRAMAPLLDRLGKEFPGLRIVKVDAEAEKDLLGVYNVRSLPTLQVYRGGKLVDELLGKVPYELMRRAVTGAA